MVSAAAGRPIIEMGSPPDPRAGGHRLSARAAYLAGFASTSNLAAGRVFGVPTAGTAAHAFTLLHDDELGAFRAQIAALGPASDAALSTPSTSPRASRTQLRRAVRRSAPYALIPAILACWPVRPVPSWTASERLERASSSAATWTSTRSLRSPPRQWTCYGAGTAVVTGSGAPTAGFVYKLVDVDGRPVAKRSEHKESHGGRKFAYRAQGNLELRSRRLSSRSRQDEIVLGPTTGPPAAAAPRRKARGRAAGSRRVPGAFAGRHGHLALGRPEASTRRAGNPNPRRLGVPSSVMNA